jgi:hypothetical protein
MVYIVSHTWPDRWDCPGKKDRILVYSNCEVVELFNDLGATSLGVRKNPGPGNPFRWDGVPVEKGVLYAEGRINGKTVSRDLIRLAALPNPLGLDDWIGPCVASPSALPAGCIRVNCGGPEYIDQMGNRWLADQPWQEGAETGSSSWGHDFKTSDSQLASVGECPEPIRGTRDQQLYQTFRYGRGRLQFFFSVPKGRYRLHVGLLEPWYGIGAPKASCTNWRLFDIAVNEMTVLPDIDPWTLFGTLSAGMVSADFTHDGGPAVVHFPRIASGQALVAWLALEFSG